MFRTIPQHNRAAPLALLLCLFLLWAGNAAAGDYIPDPSWHYGGLHAPDGFEFEAKDYNGQKLVQLGNGDVVIAGEIPKPFGSSFPDTYLSLGLVRRNAAGHNVSWTNPGPYGNSGNHYIILPPLVSGATTLYLQQVKDLIVYDGLLYVLADTRTSTGFRQVNIYVFGTDGSYKGTTAVDNTFSDTRERWGSALAAYTINPSVFPSTTALLYIGRRQAGDVENIVFRRYNVTNAGVMTAQTDAIRPAIPSCPASRHCSAYDIELGGRTGLALSSPPRVHIAGSVLYSGTWYSYVTDIDPVDGNATGGDRFYYGPADSRGRALAVGRNNGDAARDDLYLVAEIDRVCRDGAVVSAFSDGALTRKWTRHIGGSTATSLCQTLNPRTVVPRATALQGDRLAIAGMGYYTPLCLTPGACPEDVVDGFAAVLNANDGTLISPDSTADLPAPIYYPYRSTPSGPRERHSGFKGIVGTGNGSFTVAGDVRYPDPYETPPSLSGKRRFTSLRIIEQTDLFSNGFESP